MITIGVQSSAHYLDNITIDGVKYRFTFNYYVRTLSWYISIADNEGTPLATGRKLTVGWNPLIRDQDSRLPLGAFYVSSTVDPIGRDGFDKGLASLKYFSEDEVDQFDESADEIETVTIEAA